MKKLIYIVLLLLFSVSITNSKDFALLKTDSIHSQKKEKIRNSSDTSRVHQKNKDKFVDNDGDGINDNRGGRGMGLGKGLGKHDSNPSNYPNHLQSHPKKKIEKSTIKKDKVKEKTNKTKK